MPVFADSSALPSLARRHDKVSVAEEQLKIVDFDINEEWRMIDILGSEE